MSFGVIASFYDDLMSNIPYTSWIEYLHLVHAYGEVRPHSILDVCCGTGTMAAMLDREGYDLTGFDLSEDMIQVARTKSGPEFHVADATALDLGRTFDAAFAFFDSLNYITTLEGFQKAVARVSAHLGTRGTFLFDLNTAYAFEHRMFDQRERSRKAKVTYDWKGDYDSGTRIIRVQMDFEVAGEKYQEVHVQRAHSSEEVVAAMVGAGFSQIEVFDGFTLNPPTKKSDRLHYFGRKG
ncbi:MAG: class I SAM-dependent methyltransferase [Fimbriimonadaceae bacterium]